MKINAYLHTTNSQKMATIFETRLIGNIGKDATIKNMEKGVIAINFPVAHNKNWRDKRTGEQKTKTTWINCTIWKREGANMRIVDFLKRGTLVELQGTPFAKAYTEEDGVLKTEIRLNVTNTNILKASNPSDTQESEIIQSEDENRDDFDTNINDFTLDDDDF